MVLPTNHHTLIYHFTIGMSRASIFPIRGISSNCFNLLKPLGKLIAHALSVDKSYPRIGYLTEPIMANCSRFSDLQSALAPECVKHSSYIMKAPMPAIYSLFGLLLKTTYHQIFRISCRYKYAVWIPLQIF